MKPLSLQDAMFFWIEHRRQPMHVGGLHLFTPPEGYGSEYAQVLIEQWRQHTQAQYPFNLRPVLRMGHWFWDEDREFELDYHLRHSALPRPGRIRELLALVSRLHGTLMDRSRPMWEVHVIEGLADGRVAVYGKVHHALFDGVAATRAMQAGLSESAAEVKPPMWAIEPRRREARAPAARHKLIESIAQGLRAGADLVPGVRSGLWEIVRSGQSPADATPFQAPPTMFNVPISGSRRFAAQSYALARFKAVGEAAGATINDVALAICAGALRSYLQAHDALPDKPLIAMVPVSVRAADSDGGNQVGMMMANLATHVADPLARLQLIVQSTAQAKDKLSKMTRLEQIAHAAAMAAPFPLSVVTGHARRRPPFNIVISNVPGPRQPLYMAGMRLDQSYPLSIPVDYQALNITLTSYAGQLGFGYTACRRSLPAMQRLLDYTEQALEELEQALAPAGAPAAAPKKKRARKVRG